jgi:hypothetical protein
VGEGTPGDPAGPEEIPDLRGSYTVGDYLNLELTLHHDMHVLEASVIFTHEDDDALEVIITGEPELEEADSFSMTSTLRVSRRVTLEDVPGTYALSRLEIVTASTRVLTKEYERRPAFEIVPEPDLWNVTMNLDRHTRRPLYPAADEYGDESDAPDPEK